MNREIERKYAIKYIPEDLNLENIINIKQHVIYHDPMTSIRIRKITKADKNIEYIYTLKTKGDIEYTGEYKIGERYEVENNITEEEYTKLVTKQISNTIDKTRIIVPIKENLKAEIDIFHGYLEGLLVVEVEFANEEEANKFEAPDWFGKEIGYKLFSNRKLAEMTKEEFESKIDKEIMENNKKVLEKLKNNKVINF